MFLRMLRAPAPVKLPTKSKPPGPTRLSARLAEVTAKSPVTRRTPVPVFARVFNTGPVIAVAPAIAVVMLVLSVMVPAVGLTAVT